MSDLPDGVYQPGGRKKVESIKGVALTVVVGLALGTIVGGVKAFNSPGVSPGGVPFRTIGVMSFVLATVMILAAAGDVRMMRFGLPRGGPRLARHLGRMCFARCSSRPDRQPVRKHT